MEQTFLTELKIKKVRHLQDITIPLSGTERKNLILTGKNGCGKTSVLDAIALRLDVLLLVPGEYWNLPKSEADVFLRKHWAEMLAEYQDKKPSFNTTYLSYYLDKLHANLGMVSEKSISETKSKIKRMVQDIQCRMKLNQESELLTKYKNGQFIIAYYGDTRKLEISDAKHIEKVHLQPYYRINDKPARELGKYLADMEVTRTVAQSRNIIDRAVQIEDWFTRFENILRRIYGEPSLKLDFNIDTFQFSILIDGREPFDFNTMSMGYAAVFDIVADLMMRMESQRRYDLEGIVLIDEIETHLHVELQKQIVPILTELFPNIQFILTTHSPFILSSAPNAVVYDLETRCLVQEGMKNLSYEGIVKGYFGVDTYSEELRNAFEEYKSLVTAADLTDVQRARLAVLRDYLDEVPDYLAREIAYEYSLLKLEYDD